MNFVNGSFARKQNYRLTLDAQACALIAPIMFNHSLEATASDQGYPGMFGLGRILSRIDRRRFKIGPGTSFLILYLEGNTAFSFKERLAG